MNSNESIILSANRAALWNFRWQVKGFSFEAPNATSVELNHRFTSGSGISRVDFNIQHLIGPTNLSN